MTSAATAPAPPHPTASGPQQTTSPPIGTKTSNKWPFSLHLSLGGSSNHPPSSPSSSSSSSSASASASSATSATSSLTTTQGSGGSGGGSANATVTSPPPTPPLSMSPQDSSTTAATTTNASSNSNSSAAHAVAPPGHGHAPVYVHTNTQHQHSNTGTTTVASPSSSAASGSLNTYLPPSNALGSGGSEGGLSGSDDAVSWCSSDSTGSSTSSTQLDHHRRHSSSSVLLNMGGSVGSSGGVSEGGNSSSGSVGTAPRITPSSTPTLPALVHPASGASPSGANALSKQIMEKKSAEARLQKQKREALIVSALPTWKGILSKPWPANPHKDKVLKALLEVCVPPSVRGAVWEKLVSNDLMISAELYQVMQHQYSIIIKHSLGRAESQRLIETDIEATFPYLNLFKVGCPFYEPLKSLVQAYVAYRPDIGYIPGMSHVCAVLLLNIDKEHACFMCLANIFNSRLHRSFSGSGSSGGGSGGIGLENYLSAFDMMLRAYLPAVHSHFSSLGITVDIFVIDCVLTLMSKVLPLDCVVRIWDLYFCAGEQFFMRVMIAWIRSMRQALLQAEFAQCIALLTKGVTATPVVTLTWEELYSHVKAIPRLKTVKWETFIKTAKPLPKTPSSKKS
ncbi:TBC1 domain family member 14 [Pelomyxa schiedti]|nr:TBC1 domain family member 14 [Pelomyxa schiedti]